MRRSPTSRGSRRGDAETFREWNAKAERMTEQIFLAERYAEPLAADERAHVLRSSALGSEFLDMCNRQPLEVVEELFENEHVKLLFLFKVSLFGTWLTDTLNKTSPMGSVIRAFDLTTGYQLCKGGQLQPRAWSDGAFHPGRRGVLEPVRDRPDRRREWPGRRGWTSRTDARHGRRQFVASTLDVHQTFEDFVGRDQLPAAMTAKLGRVQLHRLDALRPPPRTVKEQPHFAASAFDPNLQLTQKWSLGAETMEDLNAAFADVSAGRGARDRAVRIRPAQHARSQPRARGPAHHLCLARHAALDPDIGGQDYDAWKEDFADRIMDRWAEYAPNMTPDNVLGRSIYTAKEYVQELPNMRHGDIFMGALVGRTGHGQAFRLPHADREPLHGRLRHPIRAVRSPGGGRLHRRRNRRGRSGSQALVAT